MNKILKFIGVACTIISVLACSVGGLFSNLIQTTPTPEVAQANLTVNPSQPNIEIISQRELTGEEVKDFVIGAQNDQQGNILLAWAQQQGYVESVLKINGGEIAELSNGITMRGVAMGKVMLLGFSKNGINTSTYQLLRIEGTADNPVLILFNQVGRVEISKNGIDVYKNDVKLGSSNLPGVSLASYLTGSNKQAMETNTCTESDEDVFRKCMGGVLMDIVTKTACQAAITVSVIGFGALCLVAGKVVWTPQCMGVIFGFFAGATMTKCPQFLQCWWKSKFDYPPTVEISGWQQTGETKWIDTLNVVGYNPPVPFSRQWIKVDIHTAQLFATDDRKPAPAVSPPVSWIKLGSGETLVVMAKDCNNQVTRESFIAPGPSESESDTMTKNDPNETPKPLFSKESTYRGKWCSVEQWNRAYDGTSAILPTAYICAKYADVSFTLRFNTDGTLTMYNIIYNGEPSLEKNPRVYKPDLVGSYSYTYTNAAEWWKHRIILNPTGLTYVLDFEITSNLTIYKKITLPGHIETHFDLVSK